MNVIGFRKGKVNDDDDMRNAHKVFKPRKN